MTSTPPHSVATFYDELAADYHLVYTDWDAGIARQGATLDRLLRERIVREPAARHPYGGDGDDHDRGSGDGTGAAAYDVLDCSCGIGTQAIGLALHGHRVAAADISAAAVARAAREAAARGAAPRVAAVADMRQLPFAGASFDAVVCADNSLPHLLTEDDVLAALTGMRRVLRPGGALVLTVRSYDSVLRERPVATHPQPSPLPDGRRAITFQLWHWHDDGEHYDLEHFQLLPVHEDREDERESGDEREEREGGDRDGTGGWRVGVRRATYWAISRQRLTGLVLRAGFTDLQWEDPDDPGAGPGHSGNGGPRAGSNRNAHDVQDGSDERNVMDGTVSSAPSPSPERPRFFQPVLTAVAAGPPPFGY